MDTIALDSITYGPVCRKCGARTRHQGNTSEIQHAAGCTYQYVGPEGSIERRAREARENRRARFTVSIDWRYSMAAGTVEVCIEASSMEAALSAALDHNETRVITEGGAGMTSCTITPTPNADLTPEEEF